MVESGEALQAGGGGIAAGAPLQKLAFEGGADVKELGEKEDHQTE